LDEFRRRQRAIVLGQLGLVVEKLQMARRPRHEQEDNPLGPRGVVGRPGCQRVGQFLVDRCSQAGFTEQFRKRDGSKADAAFAEEPTTRQELWILTAMKIALAIHDSNFTLW